jgi:hypothetical protein
VFPVRTPLFLQFSSRDAEAEEMAEDEEVGVGEVEEEEEEVTAPPEGGGGDGDAPLGEAEGGASALLSTDGGGEGFAHTSFRTLRTHQRCAPPAPDAPGGVLGFELACCAAGLAAGGYIVWRKRRAARGGAGTAQRV